MLYEEIINGRLVQLDDHGYVTIERPGKEAKRFLWLRLDHPRLGVKVPTRQEFIERITEKLAHNEFDLELDPPDLVDLLLKPREQTQREWDEVMRKQADTEQLTKELLHADDVEKFWPTIPAGDGASIVGTPSETPNPYEEAWKKATSENRCLNPCGEIPLGNPELVQPEWQLQLMGWIRHRQGKPPYSDEERTAILKQLREEYDKQKPPESPG